MPSDDIQINKGVDQRKSPFGMIVFRLVLTYLFASCVVLDKAVGISVESPRTLEHALGRVLGALLECQSTAFYFRQVDICQRYNLYEYLRSEIPSGSVGVALREIAVSSAIFWVFLISLWLYFRSNSGLAFLRRFLDAVTMIVVAVENAVRSIFNLQQVRMDDGEFIGRRGPTNEMPHEFTYFHVGEEKKAMFREAMLGFESFAKLRGYGISVSLDTSLKDRVGVKFTILDAKTEITSSEVKSDLAEYIERVRNGGDFSDLPVEIDSPEHRLILSALDQRLSMAKHEAETQRAVAESYKVLLGELAGAARNTNQGNITIISEIVDMSSKYVQTNSPGATQGEHAKGAEISSSTVGNLGAERSTQAVVDEIDDLIAILERSELEEKETYLRFIQSARDEISKGADAEEGFIKSCLTRFGSLLERIETTSELYKKAKSLLTMFGIL
ncbi:hypothetical protein [Tropicimonas sp. S265A]|uniref:hypothetical protein n=1 Tax=Tropicimonas sp. S265A TaxID=3415134 RepID=UPI003C7E6F86